MTLFIVHQLCVDVIRHDHTVVHRAEPARHDDPNAPRMIQAVYLLGQGATDRKPFELCAKTRTGPVFCIVLKCLRRRSLAVRQPIANVRHVFLEGGERRYYIIEMSHEGHAQGPRSDEFSDLVGDVYAQINNPKRLAALYAALMARKLSDEFNPKSMREANATPIMRELQAQSGNEADETLEAILAEHCVSVIPSSDFKELVKYLNARNDNAVRNALMRLGWESSKLRWAKKQRRVWVKKGLMIENGRIQSADLADTLDGAVANGFVWFPLEYYVEATWTALRDTKLKVKFRSDRESPEIGDPGDGENGPFLDSTTHRRYLTWKNDNDILAGQPKFLKHVED